MPLSNQQHYRERVFTSAIGEDIDNSKGQRHAARHVVDYDDKSALSWLADLARDQNEAVSHLSDSELEGTIEWYLRVGSSKEYKL